MPKEIRACMIDRGYNICVDVSRGTNQEVEERTVLMTKLYASPGGVPNITKIQTIQSLV